MSGRRLFLARLATSGAGCALAGSRSLEAEPLQDPFAPGASLRVEEGGTNPTPARWWKALPDGWAECGVCPRACRISEDERGTCGTRENRKGRLYTLVALASVLARGRPGREEALLPRAARLDGALARHRGLQPRVQVLPELGDRAGATRAGPELTLRPADVVTLAKRKGAPLVACTYTEPVVFSEYVLDIAVAGRAAGRAHGHDLERLRAGAAARRPLPRDRGVQGRPQGLRRGLLPAAHRRRARSTCSRPCAASGSTAPGSRSWPSSSPPRTTPRPRSAPSRASCATRSGPRRPSTSRASTPSYRLQNLPPTPVATLERCRDVAMAEGLRFVYLGNVPGTPARTRTARAAGRSSSAASAWRSPRTS